MEDFLFRGDLATLDPDVTELINLEAERQLRRLIMIPSESTIPHVVREALTSPFHNIYAEGYPPDDTRTMTQPEIMDVDMRLADYRRYSDPRYYKGTEFADLIEALAKRRGAELFATGRYKATDLYLNVQPLSGAPANSAVYTALIQPGDTIMGMNLLHGGHLSHGSPAARSGKQYRAVFYGVDPETELLDYDNMHVQALLHHPKIIIGGYSSYPWSPDWARMREIADECGALLMADIAHVAGLVIAGVYPSPVGIADIVTFTSHKTLGGPRGAVILTHRADLAKKLDRGVFPGEQGGPHVHAIAALAVAFKLAATPQFKALQVQIVQNAKRLAEKLTEGGLRVVHGGTDTHLLNVDLKPIVGVDGTRLSGDMGARLLELVGITCNRNTLPSDDSAARPSGIRLGTPWITQRGFKESEIDRLAEIIAMVLTNAKPFSYEGKGGKADARAKLDYAVLHDARASVDQLAEQAGRDYDLPVVGTELPQPGRSHFAMIYQTGAAVLEIRGAESSHFLDYALTSDVYLLKVGESQPTCLLYPDATVAADALIEHVSEGSYHLHLSSNAAEVLNWLQSLSDGFVIHDPLDLYGKIPGPVAIRVLDGVVPQAVPDHAMAFATGKGYFVGINGEHYAGAKRDPLPQFTWIEPTDAPIKTTPLHTLHKDILGAKMVPFAGYDMPVWYTSVSDEHAAVRTSAGLFDVTHMGVWEVSGPASEVFLNGITANDIFALEPGQAHYSYLLDIDGTPFDDIYVYRLEAEKFMIVVNASNNDKDWAWVNAVHAGSAMIDPARPAARLLTHSADVTLRDLRDPASGKDRRVDIALQGPASRDILLSLHGSDSDKSKIKALQWSTLAHVSLGGHDLIVSRTGYTGERIAYELFPHPDEAAQLFSTLIESGAKPCGLAARDSTRTEAGLPLYGHELGGDNAFTPGDAGFANYVKLWKPFFVGKPAYLAREHKRDAVVTRFRMNHKGVKPPQNGDPLVDRRGRVIGVVTSCSIDSNGFQTGQAYFKEDAIEEDATVYVFSGTANARQNGKPLSALRLGDKALMPDAATVLSHFPKKR
ncbi:MAG: serine hydroxymethyltransferase [Chloroflexota bacterium]